MGNRGQGDVHTLATETPCWSCKWGLWFSPCNCPDQGHANYRSAGLEGPACRHVSAHAETGSLRRGWSSNSTCAFCCAGLTCQIAAKTCTLAAIRTLALTHVYLANSTQHARCSRTTQSEVQHRQQFPSNSPYFRNCTTQKPAKFLKCNS
jgi:hypothetical protein